MCPWAEGLELLDQAIKKGCVEAICLKENYLKMSNPGNKQKMEQVIELYQIGAENLDIMCLFALAEIYDHGDGGFSNPAKAVNYYKKCVEHCYKSVQVARISASCTSSVAMAYT